MRTLLPLGCLFLFTGLSLGWSHTASANPPPPVDNMAQLVIDRDGKVPSGCEVELRLEERPVGQLAVGGSVSLDLPAGTHYLRARLSAAGACNADGLASGQSVLLNPGETREYRVMLDNDALFLAPLLK